jgi:hypothetical protein
VSCGDQDPAVYRGPGASKKRMTLLLQESFYRGSLSQDL